MQNYGALGPFECKILAPVLPDTAWQGCIRKMLVLKSPRIIPIIPPAAMIKDYETKYIQIYMHAFV